MTDEEKRIVTKVPKDLYDKLVAIAREHNVSVSAVVKIILSGWLADGNKLRL